MSAARAARRLLATVTLLVASLASCSDPAAEAPAEDAFTFDVVTFDVTTDAEDADARLTADAIFGADAAPGTFGAPCTSHFECDPGLCAVIEGHGQRCVRACMGSAACPEGWRCVGEDADRVGLTFVCLPEVGGCVEPSECGDCDLACNVSAVGAGTTAPFVVANGRTDGVAAGPDGALAITPTALSVTASEVWVANADERTVSRVDAGIGAEVGRYVICDEPSAIAVSLHGDALVGCRGDGRVARVLAEVRACPDANGNQRVDTADDVNEDYQITGFELLAEGEDECVRWTVTPGGADGVVTGVAFDRGDRPWVAVALADGGGLIARLDPMTGATLESIAAPGEPGALAFAADGALWTTSGSARALVRLDPGADAAATLPLPGDLCGPDDALADVAVDHAGTIWVAAGDCGLVRYRPADDAFTRHGLATSTRGPAVRAAVSRPGRLAVAQHDGACGDGDSVALYDTGTLSVASRIDLDGVGPAGVAFDARGDLWIAGSCQASVRHYAVDPNGLVLARTTGGAPGFVGDATGRTLRTITAPGGFYRVNVVGWPDDGTRWLTLDVDATLAEGAELAARWRAATTLSAVALSPWSEMRIGIGADELPLSLDLPELAGRGFLEVEVGVLTPPGTPAGSLLERVTVRYTLAD